MRLGRLATHFVHLHPQYSSEKEDKKMDIKCLNCGCEVDLAQAVFENYLGTVKCFSCSSMRGLKIQDRVLHESSLFEIRKKHLFSLPENESVSIV